MDNEGMDEGLTTMQCGLLSRMYALSDTALWLTKFQKLEDMLQDAEAPEHCYQYCRHIVNSVMPHLEPAIMRDAQCAFLYVVALRRRRWPEAEAVILADKRWGPEYSKRYIKQGQ